MGLTHSRTLQSRLVPQPIWGMMSRELSPILDGHTDNIASGNGFYALVPIPAHDIRTHGLAVVVNHDHRVGTHFGGFLA